MRKGVNKVALRLFEHNEKAYHAAVRMMEQYGKAAIVHPTGTGKSYIAFKLIEDNPEKVVIWLSPSEYIFKTQLESLKRNDPDFPLANVHFYTYAKLMCCTQAQLDDIAAQEPAYIILDEFHRAGAECWGESTVALLKLCPEAKLLGLTATNIRYLDNNRDMAEELFDSRVASDMTLGEWLTTQRRVRAGQIPGNLTEQQVARLDSIGMEWGNRNDAAWEHGLEEARKFREQFGNLQVPAKYKTKNDYPLGKWINNARKRRSDGKLTEERIRQLDQMGMIWSVFDAKWEQGYALAAIYAQEYGNLDVPRDYKTADGKTLGRWIQNQELAYEQKKLSADQIKRLETIGMQWGSRYDRQWNEVYQAAKRYFEANGDLDVPVAYVSPEGYALGKWVRRQQYAYRNPEKSNAILSQERIELLDAIGMQWEKPDPWQHRYELAQEYKRCHGNLEIPAKYKTADGIWLSRWVYNQKRLLQSGSKKLSEEQKKKLKELLGYYVKISA